MFEARYVHTRGQNLLQALAFNQGFDLNDPSTPDHIYDRFNQAYLAAGAPNGPLNSGSTARDRGLGKAFGFANPFRVGSTATCAGGVLGGVAGAPLDLNLANAITCSGNYSRWWTAHQLRGARTDSWIQRSGSADSAIKRRVDLSRRAVWSDSAAVTRPPLQRFLHVVQVDRYQLDRSGKHRRVAVSRTCRIAASWSRVTCAISSEPRGVRLRSYASFQSEFGVRFTELVRPTSCLPVGKCPASSRRKRERHSASSRPEPEVQTAPHYADLVRLGRSLLVGLQKAARSRCWS